MGTDKGAPAADCKDVKIDIPQDDKTPDSSPPRSYLIPVVLTLLLLAAAGTVIWWLHTPAPAKAKALHPASSNSMDDCVTRDEGTCTVSRGNAALPRATRNKTKRRKDGRKKPRQKDPKKESRLPQPWKEIKYHQRVPAKDKVPEPQSERPQGQEKFYHNPWTKQSQWERPGYGCDWFGYIEDTGDEWLKDALGPTMYKYLGYVCVAGSFVGALYCACRLKLIVDRMDNVWDCLKTMR